MLAVAPERALKYPITAEWAVAGLLFFSVTFNAILAVVNAHAFALSPAIVAGTEMMIAAAGTALAGMLYGRVRHMSPAFMLFLAAIALFALVTLINGQVYLKSFRDFYLICLFFTLGALIDFRSLNTCFRALALLILLFMVVEGWFTPLYIKIFEPASYFANTRGIEKAEFGNTGLFRNSLSFEGRFSFGIFHTHRLSSIFLEQLSLANYAVVIALFTSAFWERLKSADRILYIALTIFIILTTNGRTASALSAVIIMGHFIFPLLPRYTNILYMPLILLMSALFFYDGPLHLTMQSDDIKGRLAHSMARLAEVTSDSLLGGNLAEVAKTPDAGYVYIIYTQTIAGLIALWLFATFCIKAMEKGAARMAHGLTIFFFVALLVGAAVFTAKIAPALWLFAGYFYHRGKTGLSAQDP